jgi:hypothetical protein
MPISVACTCGYRFRVEDSAAGKGGTCPACNQPLKLEGQRVAPYDLFISYSSKDKTIADAAVAVLEQRGLRCWIAPRDIVAGKEWSESIIEGIEQSRLMVLIFSQHSNQSQQVVREVERAVAKGLAIIPFRIEDIPASKSMEYFISSRHWLDAWNPPLEQHLNRLAGMAGHLLDNAPPPKSADDRSLASKVSAASGTLMSRDQRTRLMLTAAGVVLLAAVIVCVAIWGLRDPIAPQSLIALKAEAEAMARQVQAFEPAQGLGEKQREVERAVGEGADLFGDKQFQKAELAYRRAIDSARTLQELESHRESARAADKIAQEAQAKAEGSRAKDRAATEWEKATGFTRAAEQLFIAGDFAAAARQWAQAAEAWDEAAAKAEQAGQPQMKALALWLGYATNNVALYEQLRPRAVAGTLAPPGFGRRGPPLVGIAPATPADWPPFKRTVDLSARILEAECRPNLGLDDSLFTRFFETSEQGVRDAIVTEMFKQLADKHGEEVERAGRLGTNLAILRTACYLTTGSTGTSMTRASPRPAASGGREVAESVDKAVERAYQCGASQELVDDIKSIRRTWDSVHDGFLHGEWAIDEAHDKMRQQVDGLIEKYFGNVEVATAYFAGANPAEPPARVEPDPTIAAAVEALANEGGQFTFDLQRADRPPISLGLPLRGTSSKSSAAFFDKVLPEVVKLQTLRALNLGHTGVTDEQLGRLASLTELERLHLTQASLTSAGLAHLKHFPKLKQLSLNSVPVDDQGAKILAQLEQLEDLDLYGSSVSDQSVAELAKLKSLKKLWVRKTKITPEGLARLKESLPQAEIDGD